MTQGIKKTSQKESKDCKNNFEQKDMSPAQGLSCESAPAPSNQYAKLGFCYLCFLSQRMQQWQQTSALAPHYHSPRRHPQYHASGSQMHHCLDNGVHGCRLKGGNWVTVSVSAGGHLLPNSRGQHCNKLRRRLFLRKPPPYSRLSLLRLGL